MTQTGVEVKHESFRNGKVMTNDKVWPQREPWEGPGVVLEQRLPEDATNNDSQGNEDPVRANVRDRATVGKGVEQPSKRTGFHLVLGDGREYKSGVIDHSTDSREQREREKETGGQWSVLAKNQSVSCVAVMSARWPTVLIVGSTRKGKEGRCYQNMFLIVKSAVRIPLFSF